MGGWGRVGAADGQRHWCGGLAAGAGSPGVRLCHSPNFSSARIPGTLPLLAHTCSACSPVCSSAVSSGAPSRTRAATVRCSQDWAMAASSGFGGVGLVASAAWRRQGWNAGGVGGWAGLMMAASCSGGDSHGAAAAKTAAKPCSPSSSAVLGLLDPAVPAPLQSPSRNQVWTASPGRRAVRAARLHPYLHVKAFRDRGNMGGRKGS